MGNISKFDKLPGELKNELDSRIRCAGYGECIETAEWLSTKGVETSKSAVHRYIKRLKGRDDVVASLSDALGGSDETSTDKKEVLELLLELGALRVKESAIIAKLNELGIAG